MSLGSRSGVNWMRRKLQPMEVARLLASIVLPTPGTSSTRMWPWATRAASARSMTGVLPTMTRETFSTIDRAVAEGVRLSCTDTSPGSSQS